MDLSKKKALAARAMGIGVGRVRFNAQRLDEIKEAITKQDIRDLVVDKAIYAREVKGRRANEPRRRRRAGSIRMKPNQRKRNYMILTRKLRAYAAELRKHGSIKNDEFLNLRKEVKSKQFRSKSHMKERIEFMKKERKVGEPK